MLVNDSTRDPKKATQLHICSNWIDQIVLAAVGAILEVENEDLAQFTSNTAKSTVHQIRHLERYFPSLYSNKHIQNVILREIYSVPVSRLEK
jgi:hypothetical protein